MLILYHVLWEYTSIYWVDIFGLFRYSIYALPKNFAQKFSQTAKKHDEIR